MAFGPFFYFFLSLSFKQFAEFNRLFSLTITDAGISLIHVIFENE